MRAVAALLLPFLAAARIHHLVLNQDSRAVFSIENFGFVAGGRVEIRVHDVSVSPASANHTMGFLLFPSTSDASTSAAVDMLLAKKEKKDDSWWCAGAASVLWREPLASTLSPHARLQRGV